MSKVTAARVRRGTSEMGHQGRATHSVRAAGTVGRSVHDRVAPLRAVRTKKGITPPVKIWQIPLESFLIPPSHKSVHG